QMLSPVVTLVSGLSFVEGDNTTKQLATLTDNDGVAKYTSGGFQPQISWGDGSANSLGTVVIQSLSLATISGYPPYTAPYTTPPPPFLQVSVPGASAGGNVVVNPATLNSYSVPGLSATIGTAFTGTVATFYSGNRAATPSNFTATINWGDGT